MSLSLSPEPKNDKTSLLFPSPSPPTPSTPNQAFLIFLLLSVELTGLGLGTDFPGGLLQAGVALLVRAAGTETDADEGGPRPPLEDEDGEDDTEAEAEGGLDEEVGEAAVPLLVEKGLADGTRHGGRGGSGHGGRGRVGHGDDVWVWWFEALLWYMRSE